MDLELDVEVAGKVRSALDDDNRRLKLQLERLTRKPSCVAGGLSNQTPLANHTQPLSHVAVELPPAGNDVIAQHDLESDNQPISLYRYHTLKSRFEAERTLRKKEETARKEQENAAQLSNATVRHLEGKVAEMQKALSEEGVKMASVRSGAEQTREKLLLVQKECDEWKESYRVSKAQLEELQANTKPAVDSKASTHDHQALLNLTKKISNFDAKVKTLENELRDAEAARVKVEEERDSLRKQLEKSLSPERPKIKKKSAATIAPAAPPAPPSPAAASSTSATKTHTTLAPIAKVPSPAPARVPPTKPSIKTTVRPKKRDREEEAVGVIGDELLPATPVKKKRKIIAAAPDSENAWDPGPPLGRRLNGQLGAQNASGPTSTSASAAPLHARRPSYGIPLARGVAQLTGDGAGASSLPLPPVPSLPGSSAFHSS